MAKYKIYHIPDFVYPSGHTGKIGCTEYIHSRIAQNKKLSVHPFEFWEILEEYNCKKTAGLRERELQKKYGYKIDSHLYKGAVGRRKDYTVSDETRKKISESTKGRKRSKKAINATIEKQSGSQHTNAKLTDEQVIEIRKKYLDKNNSIKVLSEEYNVSKSVIYKVVNNLSYKNVESPYEYKHKRQPLRKLNEVSVIYIRNQFSTGKYTKKRLSEVFGISAKHISSIVKRQTWKHI